MKNLPLWVAQLLKNGVFYRRIFLVLNVFLTFIASSIFFLYISEQQVYAAVVTVSEQSEFTSGTFSNTESLNAVGEITLQSTGSWGAQSWKTPDKTISVGSAYASDGADLYVVRGLGDVVFWKYIPQTNTWENLANLPAGAFYGMDLQYLNGNIYAIFGGYQKTFARYSIANNSWEILENIPDFVYTGGSMTTDGTDIYAIRGNSSQDFYKYTVATNDWTPLTGPPATLNTGADITHINGYIYTPRGVNTTTFYRYDISANTWSTMAVLPASMNDDVDTTTDGTDLYVARQNNTTSFYKYTVATNSWSTLAAAPYASRYAGVQYVAGDGYIYFFRGNGDTRFWKYDIDADEFVGPQEAPATFSTGSDMLFYDGLYYATRGTNSTTLYSYDPANNTWATLAAAPASFNDDVRGVVAGAYLYFFRGGNTTTFYRYDPATNTWNTMTAAPATVRFGAQLAYPGSGDYIYATRGNTTSTFWRYSISGNSWETTVSDIPDSVVASYGATLLSDGTDIFFTAGIGIKRMFKYEIAQDEWSEVASLPFAPYYGTDTGYADGKIFALAGYYKDELFEYDIAQDRWRKLPSLPKYGTSDIGVYAGASIHYDPVGEVFYVTRGNTTLDLLAYTPGATNYALSGNWVSSAIDLSHVASWTSFEAEQTTPGDSSVVYQTRTSSDSQTWSDWETVVGTTIASPVNKFIQIRAYLYATSTGTQTPVLSEVSVEYVSDQVVPTNPSTVVGSSQQIGGQAITSGESYRFTNPYFTWSGASDEQTNIAGYYVYFGTDSEANPVSQGVFQTGATYIVNQALSTNTYYLRVVTQDSAENTSTPITLFEYDYIGVSPTTSVTFSQTGEFLGTNTQTATANNYIQLENNGDGFWLQERLTPPPSTMHYGSKNTAYVESTGKLYIMRGANNAVFYEYDVNMDTWSTLASAPGNVYFGGGVVEGPSGYLYALAGNNTTNFWRYDITNDTWDTDISSPPLTVSYGGSLSYDGFQYIYVLRGNNTTNFWRYDTLSDEWQTLSSVEFGAPSNNINNNAHISADMAIDRQNGLVYVTQGNYRQGFSVYDINTDSWTTLPNTPTLPYYGSSIEYDSETQAVYYTAGNYYHHFYKFDTTSEEWIQLASSPDRFYFGGSITLVGDALYAFRGENTTGFYKYSIPKNSWLTPSRGLFGREFEGSSIFTTNYGSDIVVGDADNLYLARGNYSDDFIKVNQSTGLVTRLANTPVGMYQGSTFVFDTVEEKIYLSGGIYNSKFFVYDIATNVWVEEINDPTPTAFGYGSSMVYDGSRYIYATRGNNTNTFYQFDTQGNSGSKWTTLTNAPATLSYGSKLVLKDGVIYTLRGGNNANNPFYRYTIDTNTWDSSLAPMIAPINNDGFLVDGNDGYLYAARATNTNEFYRYSLDENSWEQTSNVPAQITAGGSGESNLSNKLFALTGPGTNSYADALYTYVFSTQSSGFYEEGSYISHAHDLDSVYKWANLQVKQSTPNNTDIIVSTRTSNDGEVWSEWAIATNKKLAGSDTYNYKINSQVNQFLQVRFEFNSGDGIASARVLDYTVNYFQDSLAPTNPQDAGLISYSEADDGETIVTNVWYNHPNPYFQWPEAESSYGASDTLSGSGVSGYYVYFGTNAQADPQELGELQVEDSYTASGLTNGETYYLRVRTVDAAGNVSAASWMPFIYKFDASSPPAPESVSADPAGYTSNPSFSFEWDEVVPTGANIDQYCYKTGATEGTYAIDQCISGTSVTEVPSYRVGTNVFSVRTLDEAGNYSPYTTVSYFYADTASAPAPPTNLVVTPESNTSNSFAFSWSPPAVGTYLGSASNLSYYYSVNALPTAQSTSTTSLTYLNAGAYATLPGDNTFYIAAKDEAGNINYSNYATVTFSANTVAPGIPVNIEIADVSVKSTASWRLAVSWDEPSSVGSGVATYQIFRSTDGENFSLHSTTSGTSLVDTRLEQITYYYKVKACDSTSNCGAPSGSVELLPDGRYIEAPALVSEPTMSGISTRKATVNWLTDRTSDSRVAFGTEPGKYFDEEVSNSEQVANHILTLSNLNPGTTYYYIARWTDEDGNMGVSEEKSFTTEPPPSTEEPTAKNVSLTSALIEFISRNASKVKIYFGESAAFGGLKEVTTGLSEGTHTVELTELKDGTKYFYKINTIDIDGQEYEGETHSFTTLPKPEVSEVSIVQAQGTAQTTLLVRWTANTEVSSIVTYFPTGQPEKAKDEVNIALKSGRHRMILYNLEPQLPYTIIIRGQDIAGNEAVSAPQQITTAADTRAPQILDLNVEAEILGEGDTAVAQLIVSFKTDEPASTQVEYGAGSSGTYSQKTQEDSSLKSSHLIVFSGLQPGSVYHLRALAKDEAGNQGESLDKVVVTPKATENALDLVLGNLQLIFGFMGN